MFNNWHCIAASVIGTSHTTTNTECQDASLCNEFSTKADDIVFVGIASDGAGSVSHSQFGANSTCRILSEKLELYFANGAEVRDIEQDAMEEWIGEIRRVIEESGKEQGIPLQEYACTLLVAVIGRDCAVFAQIGDGAIVVSNQGTTNDYSCIFWPERGEYANVTSFLTEENFKEHLQFAKQSQSINDIAILTDGLQELALEYQSRTAFAPFFSGFFQRLRNTPESDLQAIEVALETFLDSRQVNERTNDDKTLILAIRA